MTIILDARTATDHFPGIGRYVVNLASAFQRIAPELDLTLLRDPSAIGQRLTLPDLPMLDCATLTLRPGAAVAGAIDLARRARGVVSQCVLPDAVCAGRADGGDVLRSHSADLSSILIVRCNDLIFRFAHMAGFANGASDTGDLGSNEERSGALLPY